MPRGYLRQDEYDLKVLILMVLSVARFETVSTNCRRGSVNESFAVVADSSKLLKISIPSGVISTLDDAELNYYGVDVSPDGSFCLASIQKQDQSFAIKLIYLANNSYVYPHYKLSNSNFEAVFRSPNGISFGANGTYALVADSSGKIRMILLNKGLVVPSIAGPVTGDGVNFRDGPGVTATFNYPIDVKIAPGGLYALVADMGNHRIRKIDLLSSVYTVSTLAGTSQGYMDGSQALFNFPGGIAISPDGLFALVADSSNHAIRKISLSEPVVTYTIAGVSSPGFADGLNARFSYPKGICISYDGKYAFVSDSQNKKLRVINLATNDVSTLGDPTNANLFINPQLLALGPPGTCTLCQKGTYSVASSCAMCKSGTYSTAIGAADENSCVLCSASKASSQVGASDISVCSACLDGQFSAEGASVCSQCIAGEFSVKESTVCTLCSAGTFSTSDGSSKCTNCFLGTFSSIRGATSASDCSRCEIGKFSTIEGAADEGSCRSCEVGKYLQIGTVSCVNCAAGKYSSSLRATDARNCLACNAGFYATTLGATSKQECASCKAGTYSNLAGTRCELCAAGSFSEEQAIQCSKCLAGTYSSFTAASGCLYCIPGQFSQAEGGTFCSVCDIGHYNSVNSGDSCRICEAGTFSSISGSTMCLLCSAGQFSTSGICELCGTGKFVSMYGASVCESCGEGKYLTGYGSRYESDCLKCGKGSYYFSIGAGGICQECERGKYSTSAMSTTCKDCSLCPFGMEISSCNSTSDSVCYSPNVDTLFMTSRYIFAFGPMPVSAMIVLVFLKFNSVPLQSNFRWIWCIYSGANDVLSDFALLVLLNYYQQLDIFWILLGPIVIYLIICIFINICWKEPLLLLMTSSTDVRPKFQRSVAIANKITAVCLTSVPSLIVQIWLFIHFLSAQTQWLNWLIWIESSFFTLTNLCKNGWDLRRLCSFDPALWETTNASTSVNANGGREASLAGGNEFSRIGDNDESSKDSFSEPTSLLDQEVQYLSPIRDRRHLDIGGIGEISIQLEPVTEFNESFDEAESSILRMERTPKKLNFSSKLEGESLFFSGRSPFEPDFEQAADLLPGRHRRTDIPLVAEEISPSKRKAE